MPLRRIGLVTAVLIAVSLAGTASATSPKLKVKLPGACTGVVYKIDVKPAGAVSGVSVRNAAAGNALPANIRAAAAVATSGKQVAVFVFINNLAPRQLAAAREENLLELIIAGGTRVWHIEQADATIENSIRIHVEGKTFTPTRWTALGNATSPPQAIAKFSAAPASDTNAHCGP